MKRLPALLLAGAIGAAAAARCFSQRSVIVAGTKRVETLPNRVGSEG